MLIPFGQIIHIERRIHVLVCVDVAHKDEKREVLKLFINMVINLMALTKKYYHRNAMLKCTLINRVFDII